PTGPAPDLYLRWIVSTLPAGASGEISFKTAAAAGGPLLLPTFVTASLYCDPGLMAGAALGYSDTATGARIAPALMAVGVRDGPAGGADVAYGVAVGAGGNVYVAG